MVTANALCTPPDFSSVSDTAKDLVAEFEEILKPIGGLIDLGGAAEAEIIPIVITDFEGKETKSAS